MLGYTLAQKVLLNSSSARRVFPETWIYNSSLSFKLEHMYNPEIHKHMKTKHKYTQFVVSMDISAWNKTQSNESKCKKQAHTTHI
jgi:hypothetical protein